MAETSRPRAPPARVQIYEGITAIFDIGFGLSVFSGVTMLAMAFGLYHFLLYLRMGELMCNSMPLFLICAFGMLHTGTVRRQARDRRRYLEREQIKRLDEAQEHGTLLSPDLTRSEELQDYIARIRGTGEEVLKRRREQQEAAAQAAQAAQREKLAKASINGASSFSQRVVIDDRTPGQQGLVEKLQWVLRSYGGVDISQSNITVVVCALLFVSGRLCGLTSDVCVFVCFIFAATTAWNTYKVNKAKGVGVAMSPQEVAAMAAALKAENEALKARLEMETRAKANTTNTTDNTAAANTNEDDNTRDDADAADVGGARRRTTAATKATTDKSE